MKCIIVYQSKTGFTKRYAEWMQKALHCDIKDIKDVTGQMLSDYDRIIFGSYIRIEKVCGWKKFKKRLGEDSIQKLVLFATGSTSVTAVDHINGIWERSMLKEELSVIPHFYMQSGLNYEKMSLGEKLLMKVFAVIMKWKKRREGTKLSQDISKSYDHSSKKYIVPLVEYVTKQNTVK
ncbi:MAG: hypothetical protein E7256_03885 [Lachnospiraceae bacterium]|nr:hypothetical protein [Lachnospiraceae bacterium]